MEDRRPVRGFFGPFAIEIVLEDGIDAGVGVRPDVDGAAACRLEALRSMLRRELHDADTGAEPLNGMERLGYASSVLLAG